MPPVQAHPGLGAPKEELQSLFAERMRPAAPSDIDLETEDQDDREEREEREEWEDRKDRGDREDQRDQEQQLHHHVKKNQYKSYLHAKDAKYQEYSQIF